jgi:DNA polymerase III epsilon subunit-like protein
MLVLDIEASGLDYGTHSIVSLGALDLDNPANRFYAECKVWDGAQISDEALAVCGFSREEVLDESKMSEAELIRNFIDWSTQVEKDKTLAGQNVSFDRDYIQAACRRAHREYPFAHRTIDVHSLAWMHQIKRGLKPPVDAEHKRSALNLDAVLVYCGIPDEPQPHNALTGALSHAECISRLLYDKKLLPEFEEFDIPWVG